VDRLGWRQELNQRVYNDTASRTTLADSVLARTHLMTGRAYQVRTGLSSTG